jgi:glucan-binding YG repeat protein
MMKYKILKKILVITIAFTTVFAFSKVNLIKANAEGWVYENNSWRYYSGPDIETGWCKSNGNWYYLDENGLKKTGWIKSEGKFYYLDPSSGKMLTGWIQDQGKWYYLNASGEMLTGWFKYKGNLYYLNTSGVMVRDIYIGEYYLGPNGAWKER